MCYPDLSQIGKPEHRVGAGQLRIKSHRSSSRFQRTLQLPAGKLQLGKPGLNERILGGELGCPFEAIQSLLQIKGRLIGIGQGHLGHRRLGLKLGCLSC